MDTFSKVSKIATFSNVHNIHLETIYALECIFSGYSVQDDPSLAAKSMTTATLGIGRPLGKWKFAHNYQNRNLLKMIKMTSCSKWNIAHNNRNYILLKMISDQKKCVLTVHHLLAKCLNQSVFDPPNKLSTMLKQETKGK